MNPIHLFSPFYRVEECLAEIRQCLESGWTGPGSKTLELEQAFRKYNGAPHAHFVNSCTAALHLAVRLLKEQDHWQDGDEVISTPLTFVSTNHALLYEHLKPVFADVDEHLCLDPASVESRISPRTRAVMFVGMGGNPGRYAEIVRLCRSRGLRLILDAAHMTGTRLGDRHIGGDADVTAYSFHAVKNLPTADGGVVCFADELLDVQARQWSWLGIDKNTYARTHDSGAYKWLYDVQHVGFKYHGNAIMAALALVALRYVDADNGHRRQLAAWYDEQLSGVAGIELVPMASNCTPSRHLYQVLVERRDEVMLALHKAEIYPGMHYRDNTEYRMYADSHRSCPRAARASERVISLPMHLRMSQDDVSRVSDALKSAAAKLRGGR